MVLISPLNPEVEHPVGFVKDQKFDGCEVEMLLGGKVDQTPRGGHQDVDAALQSRDLGFDAHSAKGHGAAQGNLACIGLDALADLQGQFPRGGKDQGAGVVAVAARLAQNLDDGQAEGICLACSGLRAGKDVPPGEDNRYGLGLDGGRGFIALVLDSFQKFDPQAKLIK